MIFISITIDYLNQLIRTAYPGVESILTELHRIGEAFGATVSQRTTPMIMSFPDSRPFDLIQASEGISQTVKLLTAQTSHLRGAALIVHQADTLDDALVPMQTARHTVTTTFGAQVTREGKYALRDYFKFSDTDDFSSMHLPSYRSALGDADASVLSDRPFLAETLKKAYTQLAGSGTKAVFINAGKACRSVRSIENVLVSLAPGARIINLSASRTAPEEFSPFTKALTDDLIDFIIGSAGTASADLLAELRPAFKLAASSRLSGRLPQSIAWGAREFINLLLDSAPGEATLFLCDSPEWFSAEALELVGKRLATGRGSERYMILSSQEPPPSWNGQWLQRFSVPVRPDKDRSSLRSGLIKSALGTCGEEIRSGLAKRFKALIIDTMADSSDSGLADTLYLLPKEARLYLYELILAESVLDREEFAAFSSKLGLLDRKSTRLNSSH